MKRERFVRMATAVLHYMGDPAAAQKAEAIAAQMDLLVVMGEEAAVAAQQSVPPPAFPAPPSTAVVAAEPEVGLAPAADPLPAPSIIVTDTRMPKPEERAHPAAPPPTQIAKPGGGAAMKVEELNRLVQERTPRKIRLEVPLEDGTMRSVTWERNVISRHSFGCIDLSYAPLNATMSVREVSEVTVSISVDELPVNLTEIVGKLANDAIKSITPRGPILSKTPQVGANPILHPRDTYRSPELTATVSGVFDTAAGVGSPGGYTPLY